MGTSTTMTKEHGSRHGLGGYVGLFLGGTEIYAVRGAAQTQDRGSCGNTDDKQQHENQSSGVASAGTTQGHTRTFANGMPATARHAIRSHEQTAN